MLKSSGRGPTKSIPDFLRVEPDASTLAAEKMKETLRTALKPTQETVGHVMQDMEVRPGLSGERGGGCIA